MLAKGVDVSRVTLSKWYKRNGFLRVMPTHKVSSRYPLDEMLKLQEELVAKLDRYWEDGKEIVFIDECTAHAWTKAGRVWMEATRPFFISLAHTKGSSCQIQGAISNRQPQFKFSVLQEKGGNNAHSFLAFLVSI